MKNVKRFSIMILSIMMYIGVITSMVMAIEFSADSIHTNSGKTFKGKIYYKEKKIRMDILDKMHKGYNIIRADKELMWMIMPDQKLYMEVPFDTKDNIQFEKKVKGEANRKLIGTETIDSHPSEKYEIIVKSGNDTFKVYQWIAKDLNFPIKSAAIDGSWSQELKNIMIGKQPDKLFEIPVGYQKMAIPEMGKGMMHGDMDKE